MDVTHFEEVTIPLIAESLNQQDVENAQKLLVGVRKHLAERNDINGTGYKLVNKVANHWGSEWVSPVLEVCMCPDISKISIFDYSNSQIAQLLQTTIASPDQRLKKIQEIISTNQFSPPTIDLKSPYGAYWFALHPLLSLLDPENKEPPLTVERFNKYWITQDAHPRFVSLMNRILAKLGIDQPYQPVEPLYGRADVSPSISSFFVARNEKRGIEYVYQYDHKNADLETVKENYLLHDTRMKQSVRKDIFFFGMKEAGLI